jgi:hypothetical protein
VQWITGSGWRLGYGRKYGYLVAVGETEARLSRFNVLVAESGASAQLALGVTRTTIVFPLGRGPGRPGGEPELAGLAETAKVYAEKFEAGESLPGYPAWQHEAPARPPAPGYRDEPSAIRRFLDAEQRGLVGVDGHTQPGHTADGPAGCRRCQFLRENEGWMSP